MGAHNSTPQTVRIENPQRGVEIQVTPSVVSRLVGGEGQTQKNVENRQDERQTQFPCDFEEYQFCQSVEKIETMITKPITWADDVNETITALKQNLIKCYQDHPEQSLCCADEAKIYQDFIFREQLKIILKSNEEN